LIEEKPAESLPWFQKSQQGAVQAAVKEPGVESLQRLVITASGELGHALVEAGRTKEGIQYLQKTLDTAESTPSQIPLVRIYQAQARLWLAEAAERQGKLHEAAQGYAKAQEIMGAVRAGGVDNFRMQVYFVNATDSLASVLLKQGNIEAAGKEYDRSLALLEPQAKAHPDNQEVLYALAESYTGKGKVAMKAAAAGRRPAAAGAQSGWAEARDWFEKSQSVWSRVPNPARLSTSLMEVTVPAEVFRNLAECNAHLLSAAN